MRMNLLNMLVKFVGLSFFVVFCNSEILKIEDGFIRGKILRTRQGRPFFAYMSIPYAEPPIGHLRFKPPVPVKPWSGILDATRVHEKCPQKQIYTQPIQAEGDENCLFINVYRPLEAGEKLPVMVYIHGGGYRTGCGSYNCYGPNVLLDKNIIMVAFNYRLGSFGFLSTGDKVVPGNNGLKDQNLALKWVKKNIKHFRGDSSKITIFGQSAGGASVHLHILSPKSRGLFNNAISQSGTAFASWAFDANDNVQKAKKMAEHLKCPNEVSTEMIGCLRTRNAYEIVNAEMSLRKWSIDPTVGFKPTIETISKGFITKHPAEIIQSRNFSNVPWITGGNTEEGSLRVIGIFSDATLIRDFDRNFHQIAPVTLDIENIYNKIDVVTKRIRKFYFGKETINESTRLNAIDMYTDARFFSGLDEAVRLHKNYSNSNIFYYLFGYRGVGSYSELQRAGSENYGVNHCDELFYLFPYMETYLPNKTHDEFDLKVSNTLTNLWTNFSAFSRPIIQDKFTSAWKPITSNNLEYYFIGQNSHMSKKMLWKRLQFWRKLNQKFRKPLF